MKYKTILIIILLVGILPIISATSIGEFPEGKNVTIYQTCNNCTSVNFTRLMDPNNQTLITNLAGTKDGTYFSTLILSGNLTELNTYTYCYEAGNAAESKTGCLTFDITYNGKELTQEMATIYIMSMGFLIFIFILIVLGINKLPSQDATDEDGTIVQISYLKHLRPVLWSCCWGLILAMLFIISNLTLAYLPNKLLGNLFFTFFQICMWLTLPLLILWFIWIFARIFRDKEYKQMMERGVNYQGGGF